LAIFGIVLVAGYSVKGSLSRASSTPVTLVALAQTAPAIVPEQLTVVQLQMKIEQWLAAHPDRNGKTMLVNIMPTEPFRATVIRFPEADAVRWTSNPSDWSQVRLDLDRDGVDDEKWLLKDGHTYKREVLDRNGRTISSQHLSK
jgi:hypothetical protein